MKKLIKSLLRTSLCLYLLFCVYVFVAKYGTYNHIDCGTIVSKGSEDEVYKNSTETQFYLNIQFEKDGFRSIKTDATTYYGSKINERICFKLNDEIPLFISISMLIGIGLVTIMGIAIFCCSMWFIMPESWKH